MKTSAITIALVLIPLALAYPFFIGGTSATTLHLAGDSTMAIQLESRRPLTGWGEPLGSMLCDNISLLNHAKNGRSSKSFIAEGLWDDLLSQVKPNDIVLIQFGHNDQKINNPKLYTSPWVSYRQNLQRFITQIKERGAEPVLLTPIVRRAFNSRDELEPTLEDYPAAARLVAKDTGTKLIDLHTSTREQVTSAGPIKSKSIYLHLQADEHRNYPQGIADDTHLSSAGAKDIAGLVAIKLKEFFPTQVCT